MPFWIVRNDITKMDVDAIVNPANPNPGYGNGIDRQIYMAAGEEVLLKKREKIGDVIPGSSFVTPGYKLKAKYIIHTVGMHWNGGISNEKAVLKSCYRSVLKLSTEKHVKSVAIPLLASGHYGYPKDIALNIAVEEITSFLENNEIDIYLVVFDKKSFVLSESLYGDIEEYINDNYVSDILDDEEPDFFCDMEQPDAERSGKHAYKGNVRRNNFEVPGFLESKAYKAEDKCSEAEERLPMMMPVSLSAPLMDAPKRERKLDEVIGNLSKSFMEMVFEFADMKHMTDVEVRKKANIDKKAFSKLKCGTTKNPSKSTALALAIALELNLDETKDLLARAGLALSPCSRADLIVSYFIENKIYDIYTINLALFDHDENILGSAC